MGGSQPRNRHPERRTTDMMHPYGATKGDGFGIAAMFSTNRQHHSGSPVAPAFGTDRDQLANTFKIKNVKGIFSKNPLLNII